MSKIKAKFVNLDSDSLEADGDNVRVKATGAIERTASGINVATGGISDAMLASLSTIAFLDEAETVTAVWSFGSSLPTATADPSADNQFARKAYVDSVASGLDVKNSVRVTTTANITLSGEQTIDGVSVVTDDRVLVKDQSTASANGIYVCASGAWSRSSDADADAEVTGGMFVFVTEGSTQADTGWVLTTDDDITVGSTNLAFTQFTGAGNIAAGNGLTKSGNTINVVAGDDSLTVAADSIVVNVDDSTIETDVTNGVQVKDDGIVTAKIADSNVTLAKIVNVTATRLLGRGSAGTGAPQELTVGSGLSLSGTTLSNSNTNERRVETFTLDGTAITNKYVTLANTPAAAGRVVLHIKGGPTQHYADDFAMDGGTPTRLSWDSLELDGVLESGDKLTVAYDA